MATSKKVTKHLEKRRIKFEVVPHKKVYTAYDLAQTLGEKLENIAKSLLVKVEIPEIKKKGGHYYVVVVPASYNVDFNKLKKALKAKKAEIAPERVMKKLGIQPGATSPFGSMRDLGVVVDKGLLKAKKAIVGAESFTESVRIKVKDLVESEETVVAVVGKKNTLKLQKQGAKKKKKRPTTRKKTVKRKPAKKAGSKKKAAGRKAAKRKPVVRRRKR